MNLSLYGNLAGGHSTLEDYLNAFSPSEILNYFKFTVVRNPWDRLASAYHFLKNGGFCREDRDWFREELSDYTDFDNFVRNWVTRENIWKWHHFRPQYSYMLDKHAQIHIDFIAFYENIEEDFAFIANQLGKDVALSIHNQSNKKPYAAYFTEDTKKIVSDVYAEDIDMLGYHFDNCSLAQQLRDREQGKKLRLRDGV